MCNVHGQSVKELLFDQEFQNECESIKDTVLRPILISDDLREILMLEDTTLSKEIVLNDGKKVTKIFVFKFCTTKQQIAKKFNLNKKNKDDYDESIVVSVIHVKKMDVNVVEYIGDCISMQTILDEKKAFGFGEFSPAIFDFIFEDGKIQTALRTD
jgi:hypothetical protein